MSNPWIGAGSTLGKIDSYKSGKVVPSYERHMARMKDLTERMFLLNAAYNLSNNNRLKPDFDLHILPLIRAKAPLMGTDADFEEAMSYSSYEFCFTDTDVPNVFVSAYENGLTPEPHHLIDLPPSQFKAWALAAAYTAGLPPRDEHFREFADYKAEQIEYLQPCRNVGNLIFNARFDV